MDSQGDDDNNDNTKNNNSNNTIYLKVLFKTHCHCTENQNNKTKQKIHIIHKTIHKQENGE